MGRELTRRIELDATPEQVWEAIATGPGISAWFVPHEVQEREGGAVSARFGGGFDATGEVRAWEPGRRFVYGAAEPPPDGAADYAYEFLVEGREHGSTVLRMATSGFLPGDDWAAEYDAMTKGTDLFFATLATYLRHFAGRTAVPVTVFGPMITDWTRARTTLTAALGLPADPRPGDRAHAAGLLDGEVYFANEDTVGIRTPGALFRFLRGFAGPVIAGHHLFDGSDPGAQERAWQAWLTTTFSGKDAS